MPKQKTHKGAAKRFRRTGGGKLMRGHSMRSHILTKKSTGRKRRLRKPTEVSTTFARLIKKMLHY